MTYLLTFACYGTRLHGRESGSVDRKHHVPGTPTLEPDPVRVAAEQERMVQAPYELDQPRRELVLQSLRETCACRSWRLLTAHVRSNHVHAVVDAEDPPEKVLNAFKAHASRKLNQNALDCADRRRWSRHGSTRYLWKREQIEDAVCYVADAQGESMALYVNEDR
jgi:REP element-mobilizing transposase RayT